MHHPVFPAVLLLLLSLAARAGESGGAGRFGFTGPEIFPIEEGIGLLHAADFDGDGRRDLVVVNNARARLTFLYNRTGAPPEAPAPRSAARRELNELPPDARFRIVSLASEKRIGALAVADFNHDGRPDLAYYGEPRELGVRLNEGDGQWGAPRRWPITDGQFGPSALSAADLDGDGHTDLVLLGESQIYVLRQDESGHLREPEKFAFSGAVKGVQLHDADGDHRPDLLLVNFESTAPIRLRRQQGPMQFGPEAFFTLPPIRAWCADDLDDDGRTELVTIAQSSGRAQLASLAQAPAETLHGAWRQGAFAVLPFTKTEKSRRGAVWADVNGDGRPDLVTALPDSGQLAVHLQGADGALETGRLFPSLTGVSEIAVHDWDGDRRPEIFLLSADERQVGVTRFDAAGRVAFPEILPFTGRPLAMTVGVVRPDQPAQIAVLLDQDGRRQLVLRNAAGTNLTQALHESFKANPTSLTLHDADQDGRPDLVALIPYEKAKVLRQTADGPFEEFDLAPPGGPVEQPWLAVADVDGDGRAELLLPQKNFLRAVVLERGGPAADEAGRAWAFRVREQINGVAATSRLTGATALPRAGGSPALVLLDADKKCLSFCERDAAGVWRVAANVELPVTEFSALSAIRLAGAETPAVALLGLNAAAWQRLEGPVWKLDDLDGYETPIHDGFLLDVVAGDLNHDGRKDLVFLETGRNYVDLVLFEPGDKLVPAERWPVFEERTFRARRAGGLEPREAVVTDFTGDGKNDLALVVHDRILLYPQE